MLKEILNYTSQDRLKGVTWYTHKSLWNLICLSFKNKRNSVFMVINGVYFSLYILVIAKFGKFSFKRKQKKELAQQVLETLPRENTDKGQPSPCNYLIRLPIVAAEQLSLISKETCPAVTDSCSGVTVDKSCS